MPGVKGRSGPRGADTSKKRTKAQIERDRATVFDMKVEGYTEAAIARKLKVHQTQVSYDYRVTMKKLAKEMGEDHKELVVIHHARYEKIFFRAMAAFEKSKQDHVRITEEEFSEGEGARRTEMREGQAGDPAFLNTALNALRKIEELFGLLPDKEMRFTGSATQTTIDWDALAAAIPLDQPVPDTIEAAIYKELEALPAPQGEQIGTIGDDSIGGNDGAGGASPA